MHRWLDEKQLQADLWAVHRCDTWGEGDGESESEGEGGAGDGSCSR